MTNTTTKKMIFSLTEQGMNQLSKMCQQALQNCNDAGIIADAWKALEYCSDKFPNIGRKPIREALIMIRSNDPDQMKHHPAIRTRVYAELAD